MKTLFVRIRLGHVALVLVGVVIGLAVGATVLPDSDETVSSAVAVAASGLTVTEPGETTPLIAAGVTAVVSRVAV